jgi:hypothetical protein
MEAALAIYPATTILNNVAVHRKPFEKNALSEMLYINVSSVRHIVRTLVSKACWIERPMVAQ